MDRNGLLTFSILHTAILSMMSLKSSLYLAEKKPKILTLIIHFIHKWHEIEKKNFSKIHERDMSE